VANDKGKTWEKTIKEMWEFGSGREQGSQDGGKGGGEDSGEVFWLNSVEN
jgi:hypothetical protein